MPSTNADRPADAVTVAEQYQRVERPLSGAVALLVAAGVVVSILYFPLATGFLVGAFGAG